MVGPVDGGRGVVPADNLQAMLAFLSPAWIEALDEAARAAPATSGSSTLVVEHQVRDATGVVTFHLVIDSTGVSVAAGEATDPTIRFSSDRATAWAVASGQTSAQRAFMSGDLQVGGDLRAVADRPESLSTLGDLFAEVRARTEQGPGHA